MGNVVLMVIIYIRIDCIRFGYYSLIFFFLDFFF